VTDPFAAPSRGDQFSAADYKGSLLLFFPTEYHDAVPTKFSEAGKPDPDTVSTHIAVLDGPLAGTVLSDSMVFGRFMVGQLKAGVNGKAVLGRLGQGQNTKGNPPWVILDPTDEDKGLARTWYQSNGDPRKGEFDAPPPPTSVVSPPTATAGPAPATNGASSANPADIVKLVKAGVDITGLSAENMALIAATLP
jgi:hypothetical protein